MNFVIEHLSKRFEDKVVLRDICFTFTEGRIYGLLGRNGAGKTTLFNCLNRDLKADGGAFWLETDGRRQRGDGRRYRLCPFYAHRAGISDGTGVFALLFGYKRAKAAKSQAAGRVFRRYVDCAGGP